MGWLVVAAIVAIAIYMIFSNRVLNNNRDPSERYKKIQDYSDRRAAKIPLYLEGFLKEEFPDFLHEITFSKCVQIVDAHAIIWGNRSDYVKNPSKSELFIGDDEFINHYLGMKYKDMISRATGECVSQDFRDFAASSPDNYYNALKRAYAATRTKIDLEMGPLRLD